MYISAFPLVLRVPDHFPAASIALTFPAKCPLVFLDLYKWHGDRKKKIELPKGVGGGGAPGHVLEREVRRVIDFEICDLKSFVGFLSGVFLGDIRFWKWHFQKVCSESLDIFEDFVFLA